MHIGRWAARAAVVAAGLITLLGSGGGGGESTEAPAQRRVSVRIDSTLGAGESFQFSLGSQTASVTQSGVAVAFANTLAQGSAYTVNQTAGPRTCTLSSNRTGTIGGADVLVTAQCGTPPPTFTLSVVVTTAVAGGETFVFTRGGGVNVSITQQNVASAFAGTLTDGSAYTVQQLSGPRACTLTPASGSIAGANATVNAACGSPPAMTQLSGELRTPVNTAVTLRNNGADDLPLTMPTAGGSAYNAQAFTFATPLLDGAAYAVTVASKPANQTCGVYKGGSGTMPVGAGALKVGCEFTWDHVSRSTGNALATRVESWKASLGGAGVAVGTTTTAYGDGRFVVFSSSATGLSPNGFRQVFWRDRFTGETQLISADADGVAGNANSDRASISADGLVVVFESYATNLVAGDGNGVRDVFLWAANGASIASGLRRISLGAGNVEANGQSHTAVVSGDGRVVAYSTEAANLLNGASGTNVIRRDIAAGTQIVVSRNGSGVAVGGDRASISEDGDRIAYWSFASNIVNGDTNGMWDIFVYQHSNTSQRRVSLRADGGERNQGFDSISGVRQPVISGNGRFVAYETTSSNVVADDTNGVADIFVVDLDDVLPVRRASLATSGAQGNAASGTGSYWQNMSFSHDGTWLAFGSDATNFGTTHNGRNIFLRHLGNGTTTPVTDATFGTDEVSLSRTGAYLALGAGIQLDSRFASTGQFVFFTNQARAWWWLD